MEFYGDKAKTIRKKSKFTLDELARKMAIFRTTLGAWENGKRSPSEIKIRSLAKALNVSVDQISNIKSDKPVSPTNFAQSIASFISPTNENKNNHQNTIRSVFAGINSITIELGNAKILIDSLTTSLASIFYIKDIKLKYILANHLFLDYLSLNKNHSVFNKTDYEFFPASEAKENDEEDRQVLLSGETVINKERHIPGSRKKRWGLISKIPVFDNEGKISGIVGSFTDITERKKQEMLRAGYEKALGSIDAYIWIGRGLAEEDGRKTIDKILHTFSNKIADKISEKLGNLSILSPEDRKVLRSLRKPNNRGPLNVNLDTLTADNPLEVFYALPLKDGEEINAREKIFYDPELDLYIGIIRLDNEKDEIDRALAQNNQRIIKSLQNLGVPDDIINKSFASNI
ncbi:MAG: PAS domain-containing protein [Lentisphaerota bacterium]